MGVCIKDYQNACEFTVSKLKTNTHVLGIIVYGSMVSGDIWEESDVDFLVITDEKEKNENIYSRVGKVKIHINYVSKNIIVHSFQDEKKGLTFNKAFYADKILFCRDKDLENIHLESKIYEERDRNTKNVEILSNLLKSIHYTKKYKNNGKIETSYQWCIEVLNDCSKLIMNMKGHVTSKDVLSFTINMNKDIEFLFKLVTGNDYKLDEKVERVLIYAEDLLNNNFEDISKPIINYLKSKEQPCSVADIKNSFEFRHINGDLNILMQKLADLKLVKESMRKYTSYGDEYLFDEIVYSTNK